MDYMNFVYAALILVGLGIVAVLVITLSYSAVGRRADEVIDPVFSELPGLNCKACGFSGCYSHAIAMSEGLSRPSKCQGIDGKAKNAASEILGLRVEPEDKRLSIVKCAGGDLAKKKFNYSGLADCASAQNYCGGSTVCQFGCLGLGSCAAVCPSGAIYMKNGVAAIDPTRCTACGKCHGVCPRALIVFEPYYSDVNVICSSKYTGEMLREICDIGCMGCKICEQTCKEGAITVTDNLAVIDHDKCVDCGDCAEKCPRKIIVDLKLSSKRVR